MPRPSDPADPQQLSLFGPPPPGVPAPPAARPAARPAEDRPEDRPADRPEPPPAPATSFVHPQAQREMRLRGHHVGYALRHARRRSIGFVVGLEGLTVSAPRDLSFVVVEDPTAAGLEPVNERLNTATHDAQPDYSEANWQLYRWQEYGYNHKEIRPGRVSFFVTELPIGLSQFEYLARATHAGTFTAMPAEAWAMYEPELWGRSGSDELRVTSEE